MDIVSILIGAFSLGATCFGIGYQIGKDIENKKITAQPSESVRLFFPNVKG